MKNPATESEVHELSARVTYLYNNSPLLFLYSSVLMMITHPERFLKTLSFAIKDSTKMKLFNKIGIGLLYRFFIASRVALILIKNDIHHLHAHFSHVPTDIAMYASLLTGIPFSFTSHANDLFERGWLLKEKVRRAKTAVTISEYNRDFLIKKGAHGDKIKIVRCGVKNELLKKQAPGPIIKNKKIKIGTLGRLVEKKGIAHLIGALSIVKDKKMDFELEIAGDGPLYEMLLNKVKECDLSQSITFLGAIAHNHVYEWLNSLDLFVLPCQVDKNGDQDGIPVVLMEAMVCGIPVISTNISGIPELIKDNVTGLLAESENPISLSNKIELIVGNLPDLKKIIENAKKRIKDEFDSEINIQRLISIIESKDEN